MDGIWMTYGHMSSALPFWALAPIVGCVWAVSGYRSVIGRAERDIARRRHGHSKQPRPMFRNPRTMNGAGIRPILPNKGGDSPGWPRTCEGSGRLTGHPPGAAAGRRLGSGDLP